MAKIGEIVSRIRNTFKGSKQDAFLTSRYIYSIVKKHAAWIIRRQDSSNKIMKMNSVFQVLHKVELEEIDKVQANCSFLTSGHTIRRNVLILPTMMTGYWGPLVRSITSIDGVTQIIPITRGTYEKMIKQSTFKYNTNKYYWWEDGYFYFPNIEWELVRVDAAFNEDITNFNDDSTDDCLSKLDIASNIPDYLLGEIETQVRNEMSPLVSIPSDTQEDKRNILR